MVRDFIYALKTAILKKQDLLFAVTMNVGTRNHEQSTFRAYAGKPRSVSLNPSTAIFHLTKVFWLSLLFELITESRFISAMSNGLFNLYKSKNVTI